MNRRKTYFLLVINLILGNLYAQTTPQFDNYFVNKFFINPAYTGIENFTEFQVLARSQWRDIDGGPRTIAVSVQSPLGNSLLTQGFSQTRVGRQTPYRINLPPTNHAGLGLSVYSDKIGPFSRTEINPSFAYHISVNRNLQLSTGIGLNYVNTSLNQSKLSPTSLGDPIIDGFQNQSDLNWNFGLMLSRFNWHLGLSSNNRSELTLFSSFKIAELGYGIEAWPIGFYRRNSVGTSSYDIGMNITWQSRVYTGLIRRNNNEFLFLGGINFNQNRMGFNFLFNLGLSEQNLAQNKNNTLEFSIILRLTRQGSLPCFTRSVF